MNNSTWNEDDDPLSVYEVAKLLNFKESTVSSWRQRHQMPEPDKLVNGGKDCFMKKTILNWAKNTNRLRNMQENSFAYKQEDDIVELNNSLEDYEVGDLDWNG